MLQPKEASVALEFEHVHNGKKDRYHVKRRWKTRQITKEPIAESLIIHKNSEPLSDFEAEHWQDFLNELIPIGLSQLFFFDGEKIQGLAEDVSGHIFLADSIKSLLGVDLVERLHSDLKIYLNRSKKDTDPDQLSQDIDSAEKELREFETELSCAVEKKAALDTQIGEIETQITHQEDQIAKEGGNYAQQREELKIQQGVLKEKIAMLEIQIREECNKLFPFALVPSLCKQLRDRLIKESEIEKCNSAQSVLQWLLESLEDDEQLSLYVRNSITKKIANLLDEQLQPSETLEDFNKVHHLSTLESQQLLDWINSCLSRNSRGIS